MDDEFGKKKVHIETLASQLDRNNEKNPDWDGDINVYHHFYNNRIDAIVELAYTRRQLANWRTIQERVETWLNALPISLNRRLYDD